MECYGVHSIHLAQKGDQWLAVVDVVMKLRISEKTIFDQLSDG
jgi:hypothetical protein